MRELVVRENRFWHFVPGLRPDLYILPLIVLVAILALIITGESFLWLIIILTVLLLVPAFIKLLKISKLEPKELRLKLEDDTLIVEYDSETKKINLEHIKAIILYAQKKDRKVRYDLLCKCDKGDKVIVSDISPGIFVGERVKRIEDFLKQAKPNIEVILFDITKYSV